MSFVRKKKHRLRDVVLSTAVLSSTLAMIGSGTTWAGDRKCAGDAPPLSLIGITAPYRAVTLAAVEPGRIAALDVDEGHTVREGDVLIRMVDDVQRTRTMMAKANAESSLGVELARAVWERDKQELDRLTALHGGNNASSKEFTDAQSAEQIARIEYETAKFERSQALLAYEREKATLELRRIAAPFTGYVVECLRRAGETVAEAEGVIKMVQLDPLLVTIDWPLSAGAPVQVGDQLLVQPFDTQWSPRTGTVAVSSRVADSASQTYKVKLTVPNGDGAWMSGLKVGVDYVPGVASAEVPPAQVTR